MRSKIKSVTDSKVFKPFTVELTMETVEEARLLFHVFKQRNLKDHLEIDEEDYNHDIIDDFDDKDGLPFRIIDEIKSRGFEV